jgi:hypothetical protein
VINFELSSWVKEISIFSNSPELILLAVVLLLFVVGMAILTNSGAAFSHSDPPMIKTGKSHPLRSQIVENSVQYSRATYEDIIYFQNIHHIVINVAIHRLKYSKRTKHSKPHKTRNVMV